MQLIWACPWSQRTISNQLGELVYTLQQSDKRDEELKQLIQELLDYMRRLATKIAA